MGLIVEGYSGRGSGRSSRHGSSSSRGNYQYQPLATRPGNSQNDVDDDEDTNISNHGGSSGSGRRSPASNGDAVIVVDRKTLQAVKDYVY